MTIDKLIKILTDKVNSMIDMNNTDDDEDMDGEEIYHAGIDDGKVYTISYTGLISGKRVYWIKGKSGGFAYDGFRLAPKGVKE